MKPHLIFVNQTNTESANQLVIEDSDRRLHLFAYRAFTAVVVYTIEHEEPALQLSDYERTYKIIGLSADDAIELGTKFNEAV